VRILWLTGIICLFTLSACSGSQVPFLLSSYQQATPVGTPAPPENYASLTNPLTADPTILNDGAILFEADCASCHGLDGQGEGQAGGSLDPKPGNLALDQVNLSDAFLFWRISEGGAMQPYSSLMPPWKSLLSEKQIWQIISYLRTLRGR
jgi:mono/diheme cytochrome c family protein